MSVDDGVASGGAVRWAEAGGVAGVLVGLFDGLNAVAIADGPAARAMITLFAATVIYGALGGLVGAALGRGRRGSHDGAAPRSWSRREAWTAGVVRLLAAASASSLVGYLVYLVMARLLRQRLHVVDVAVASLAAAALLVPAARRSWSRHPLAAPAAALALCVGLTAAALASPLLADDLAARVGISGGHVAPGQGPSAARRPNVLFVVLDTTRADHLSLYGYPRPTTPFLDELAASSTVYLHAIAPAPWTVPSHASMFTGQFPTTHAATCEHRTLRTDLPTLAEILARNGYDTVALSSNDWVGPEFGLDRGFRRFFEIYKLPNYFDRDPMRGLGFGTLVGHTVGFRHAPDKGAGAVNAIAAGWLDRWEQERGRQPFFMFVNYIDAHLPYDPPEPYRSRFAPGKVRDAVAPLVGDEWFREIFRHMGVRGSLDAADNDQLASLYDGELAYVDGRLRELVDDIRRRGLLDDTLIVIVGDHGENLGDHGGLVDHCFSLHQSVLHVPLLVRYPAAFGQGLRYPGMVSLVSIFPTILEFAGGAPDAPAAVGPLPRRLDTPGLPYALSEYDLPVSELGMIATEVPGFDVRPFAVRQRSIQTASWKLLVRSDGSASLFDLASDPAESVPLAAGSRPEGGALLDELAAWLASHKPPVLASPTSGRTLDSATRDRLRALGYVQ